MKYKLLLKNLFFSFRSQNFSVFLSKNMNVPIQFAVFDHLMISSSSSLVRRMEEQDRPDMKYAAF